MKLTEPQLEFLKAFAPSSECQRLREIIDGYILEIKDDVLYNDLDRNGAKVAIQKLEELTNKMDVVTGKTAKKPSSQFV